MTLRRLLLILATLGLLSTAMAVGAPRIAIAQTGYSCPGTLSNSELLGSQRDYVAEYLYCRAQGSGASRQYSFSAEVDTYQEILSSQQSIRVWVCGSYKGYWYWAGGHDSYVWQTPWTPWFTYGGCGPQADDCNCGGEDLNWVNLADGDDGAMPYNSYT